MKQTIKNKEMKKQTEERNLNVRLVTRGLVALDVLQNKKFEYTESFLQSMDQTYAEKIKIVDEILNEIAKEMNDFDEKFMLNND